MDARSDNELAWAPAWQLRELIGAGQVSPVDVVEECLRRIEALEPALHSFITVVAEPALEQARHAERAVTRREPLGPLHGVPVALKDELWTQDIVSTGGSLVFGRFRPTHDGTVAARLRAAGAVIIGKTNLPEFAAWPRSKNRLVPESTNPWDTTRVSGASSGGSAACVAAGLVPIALGSDGGGSIRIPSSLCGVFGLYPTPGRVPSYGSFSYSPGASIGPIARTARDVALVQQVIAGPDPRDATSMPAHAPDVLAGLGEGIEGLRIAWSPDYGHIPVDPEVRTAVEQGVSVLGELGASIELLPERLDHPWGDGEAMAAFQAAVAERSRDVEAEPEAGPSPELDAEQDWMWSAFAHDTPLTMTARFQDLNRRHRELLAPHSNVLLDFSIAPPDQESKRQPDGVLTRMRRLFERYEVLCSPTMPVVAPTASDGWATPYTDPFMGTNFTFLANHAGCPAASVPCGFGRGLPIGLQVIGKPGDEATVLRLCEAYQRSRRETHRPPVTAARAASAAGGEVAR